MNIEQQIHEVIISVVKEKYGVEITAEQVQLQKTKREFEGDITLVVFPLLRFSKKNPEATAEELGAEVKKRLDSVADYNVVKGFLNLVIAPAYWVGQLCEVAENPHYGIKKATDESPLVMIEYSSPNTNKPLHLGHIRNNLLGYSLSKIFEANGYKVVKTNIVNDRGVHICKSMYAWQRWGEGETPENSGKKGDKLVGDYYVKFDQEYKKELAQLQAKGMSQEEAEEASLIMKDVREMLRKWEAKDTEVRSLWEKMNNWVYAGFDVTYKRLGVDFDKIYYESDTYLVGRDQVLKGLNEGIFVKKDDGSVWADLTQDGLDEKILLRADGTSVYMTQDIGTAQLRFQDFKIDKMIYVVGNEQNYHFKVLSILLDRLGFEWGKELQHFSYGMVELPEGKMKSREGTVVDADDLMQDMVDTARRMSEELGKLEDYSQEEVEKVYEIIALGALKYFMLKVDPRKNMTFNPKESIDFNGNTGPFVQYTYARIQSLLRKANDRNIKFGTVFANLKPEERELYLIQQLLDFANVVSSACEESSPALIANYVYALAKEFNQFYHDCPILKEEKQEVVAFRLLISQQVGKIIKSAMELLGAGVPDRM
ncbi:MAG: arginine--tRNA ligase [Flavobacteriaceae bacterium]|nr:arginine--tRNA ligase [Flavobacteriaceae bacterium]